MRKHNVIVIIVAIAMGGGAAYLARSWLQNECLSRLSPTRSYCDRGGAPGSYRRILVTEGIMRQGLELAI
jgi:hypothetical protein